MKTEQRRLMQKFCNKRINAKKENIPFKLSFKEFVELADNAGITSSDMTIKGHHLARYGDRGGYVNGNCRFIPYLDNYRERVVSEKARLNSFKNIVAWNKSLSRKDQIKLAKKAGKASAKSFKNKTHEEQMVLVHALTKEEIIERHKLLRTVQPGWGFLSRAEKVLNIKPQVIGRFLKKYPM